MSTTERKTHQILDRSCRLRVDSVLNPLPWQRLGRGHYLLYHSERPQVRPRRGLDRITRQMESTTPAQRDFFSSDIT